jgi:hypothetical protein
MIQLPSPTSLERRDRLTARMSRPIAPAVYIGRQEGVGSVPAFDLWNLTADIEGHNEGSTVSSQTLIAAGFRLPSVLAR